MAKRILASIALALVFPILFGMTTVDGTWKWDTCGPEIDVIPFVGGFLRGGMVFYAVIVGILAVIHLASIAFNADELDVVKFFKEKRWKNF